MTITRSVFAPSCPTAGGQWTNASTAWREQSHWRDNAEGKFAEVLVARCTLIPFATQKRLNIEGVTDHGPGWHQGSAVQGSAETDAKLLSQMVVRWQQRKYLREKSGPRALKHDYYHATLYASCEPSIASD